MSNPIERTKGAAGRFALSMLKRQHFQDGGPVTGPLLGYGGGRTDTLPVSVPAGAYVIPADVVSGLPGAQGNSLHGHNALAKLFDALPLSPDEAPWGASTPNLPHGHTMPGLVSHLSQNRAPQGVTYTEGPQTPLAKGGKTESDHGEPVPILAAPGEFVVDAKHVRRIGLGNLERGHAILDNFVKQVRKKNIDTLKKLPGPVKN